MWLIFHKMSFFHTLEDCHLIKLRLYFYKSGNGNSTLSKIKPYRKKNVSSKAPNIINKMICKESSTKDIKSFGTVPVY